MSRKINRNQNNFTKGGKIKSSASGKVNNSRKRGGQGRKRNNESKRSKFNVGNGKSRNANKKFSAPTFQGPPSANNSVAKAKSLENTTKSREMRVLSTTGPDARNPLNAIPIDSNLVVGDNDSNVTVVCNLNAQALVGVVTTLMSYSYIHGYLEYIQQEQRPTTYPYYAAHFIYDMLRTACSSNKDVPRSKIPLCLMDLMAALSPKSGRKYYGGYLSYKWFLTSYTNDFIQYIYPLVSGISTNFLNACNSDADSNGWVVMSTNPTPYDETIAADAFRDWSTFLYTKFGNTSKSYKPFSLVDYLVESSPLKNSVGAFAMNSVQYGAGSGNGGFLGTTALEIFPKNRKFGCGFVSDVGIKRGFTKFPIVGGDPAYLMGSIINQHQMSEYFSTEYPAFKLVDFWEIATRLLKWMVAVFGLMAANPNVYPSPPVNLGMTMTEWLLVLRSTLMHNFSGTQFMVQSLIDKVGNNFDNFIPLLCGSNTAPRNSSQNAGMLMPLLFSENMKALRGRQDYGKTNFDKSATDLRSPKDMFPILGVYKNKTAWNAAEWVYAKGETTVSIFTETGFNINLVDGNDGTNYLNIANSPILATLVARYNKVIALFGPFTQRLSVLSAEPGINALQVISMTCFVDEVVVSNGTKKEKGKIVLNSSDDEDEVEIKVKKMKEKKAIPKDPRVTVDGKGVLAITSQQPLLGPVFAIQSLFVLPEMTMHASNTDTGTISLPQIRVQNNEMNTVYASGTFGASGLSNQLQLMAPQRDKMVAAMIKEFGAEDNEITKNLMKLSDNGEGNIFNSVVKAFSEVSPLIPVVTSAIGMFA